ncbi:MBL fold metallo-hydrolase [Myxococcota bacterium]|nr:MBL fold metallo-hydrolase [Myxococcota bacterium]
MLKTEERHGILRIELGRSVFGQVLRRANVYIYDGTMVDTGPPGASAEFMHFLGSTPPLRVINTHEHEDHIGGNAALYERYGLIAYTNSKTALYVRSPCKIQPYRAIAWGESRAAPVQIITDSLKWEGGELQIIPTPGHSEDHTMLWDSGRRLLFTGDLYVHERVRFVRRDEDFEPQVRDLWRAWALDPKLICCPHAGFIENPREAIERKIAWWRELRERALFAQKTHRTIRAITREVMGAEDFLTWVSGGHFSKWHLVRALLKAPDELFCNPGDCQ